MSTKYIELCSLTHKVPSPICILVSKVFLVLMFEFYSLTSNSLIKFSLGVIPIPGLSVIEANPLFCFT